MRAIFPLLTLLIVFISCTDQTEKMEGYSSDNLKIEPIGNGIYQHISYLQTQDYGKVGCNGMIYIHGGEAIVFDTPTNDSSSFELISWIKEKTNTSIKVVVVTHFHLDCLGGLQTFHDQNIPSFASQKTINLVKMDSLQNVPQNGFDKRIEWTIGNTSVFGQFFGEGHTQDNTIGYIPNEDAIFGGCLIKSLKAGKGYLGDANVSEWPNTVKKIRENYPDLKIVIPGHGKSGDHQLLDYTINLFSEPSSN